MLPSNEPTVSVVIPTKNRPLEIVRMLNSLRAQNTMPNEVIVVDQSQPAYRLDPFSELIHIHDTAIRGTSAARNRGAKEATGDILLFFDDDAILETDCVRAITQTFSERPELIGAQCFVQATGASAGPLFDISERIFRHGFFNPRPLSRNGEVIPRLIDTVASAYRRDLFAVERFDEALPGYGLAEDWDMTKRASRHGALTVVQSARVRHEHSAINRHDLATTVALRRKNFIYLYHKHGADGDVRNRFWKQWFLAGETLRAVKHRVARVARSVRA